LFVSPSIWTQCGALSNVVRIDEEPWRVVESQHVISTRKLVDSREEQVELEALVDTYAKPSPPLDARYHYLLSTPFRHAPLSQGSRFGSRETGGIFYSALELETALGEVAYYRHAFRLGTLAELSPIVAKHTAFRCAVRTRIGIDLRREPFARHRPILASPTDYGESQRLGRAMREDGVEAVLYFSARVPEGSCLAVFAPSAFARKDPFPDTQEWVSTADETKVEFIRVNPAGREDEEYVFTLEAFLVDGRFPAPAVT
jgi:hypothetical protein